MGKGLSIFVVLSLALAPVLAWAEAYATVVDVKDGDTFVLQDGTHVRLLDINAPEGAYKGSLAEPFSDDARNALTEMVLNKPVRLAYGRSRHDRYGRTLAHVYTQDGTWVNGQLVEQGLATAYTFADNRARADDILALEAHARDAGRGLWSTSRWTVQRADVCCLPAEMGQFHIVEGTVVETGADNKYIYLNFGPDYRTDFTIRVDKKDAAAFTDRGVRDIQRFYKDQRVRVHGRLQPVYGTLIQADHPEQIEVLDENGKAAPYALHKEGR